MIRTIKQGDTHIYNRIACKDTLFHSFTHTLFNSRDILARYCATENLIYKLKSTSGRQGFHFNNYVTILAMTAGLFLVLAFYFGRATNSFAIFDNRCFENSLNTKFTLHTLHDYINVLVAHTAD